MEPRALQYLGIKIDKDVLRALQRQAHEEDRSLSSVVRILLRRAVREPPPEPVPTVSAEK